MKENKRKTGSFYEKSAADFLVRRGCQLLAMNFYCRFGEIDLIVKDGCYVVFCEVKYRKNSDCGFPSEAVTLKKQKTLSKCAMYYLTVYGFSYMDIRFDVISILNEEFRWIRGAFDFIG